MPKSRVQDKTISLFEEVTTSQQLFSHLFEACNILRGSINQDEYKSYVTPILFFKRISDVYDEEIQTALEESNGDKEYAFFPENHRCGELGTSAYAAAELLTGEEFEGVSGKYFSMSTEPAKSSELSYSVEDAREFWEESEKLSVLRRK